MKYSAKKIANELTKTALGESYYGNALYVALDFPCLDKADKLCLHRWLNGSNSGIDHVSLQDIAVRIIACEVTA